MSTSPAVTTASSLLEASQTGNGAIDARAYSTEETLAPETAQQVVATTTQAAGIIAPPDLRVTADRN